MRTAVKNNLIFFDDPDGQVMRFVPTGEGEDYVHEVACNLCDDWTATGPSLMETSPLMLEHLRCHDVSVYLDGAGRIN